MVSRFSPSFSSVMTQCFFFLLFAIHLVSVQQKRPSPSIQTFKKAFIFKIMYICVGISMQIQVFSEALDPLELDVGGGNRTCVFYQGCLHSQPQSLLSSLNHWILILDIWASRIVKNILLFFLICPLRHSVIVAKMD